MTQDEKIFCVLKFHSINVWLRNEHFRESCYFFTALSVQPLEISMLSQPQTLSLAINSSKHSEENSFAFYRYKIKMLQNNTQMVNCYTMNLAVSQWTYLCKMKLISWKFSTAHSNRRFEEENTKCHWECLFWNKRK